MTDGDRAADVAFGVPVWDWPSATDLGGVQILFGGLFADGFDAGGTEEWSATLP